MKYTTLNKEWKPVKDFPGYYVNISGQVFGLKGTLLKPQNNNGYTSYRLMKNHKTKTVYAHRLIAQAFIPNPNDYPCINHKDGNKLNNSIDNLEWCTYKHNNEHAIKTGLKPSVDKSELREMYAKGYVLDELANKFNLTVGTVSNYTNNIKPKGKLTEEDKIKIRKSFSEGASYRQLTDRFNVSLTTIGRVTKDLRRKRESLTSEEITKIREMYSNGHTDEEIQEALNIKRSTVVFHTKGLRKSWKIPDEKRKRIRSLYATGKYTKKKLSEIFKLDQQTVARIINEQ